MKIRALAYLAAVVAIAVPLDASAQLRGGMGGSARQRAEPSVRLYAVGGYAQVQLDELNQRLAALPEPYSPVGEDLVLLGGGIHGRVDRFLLGIEVATMHSIEDGEMDDERTAKLTGMTGTLLVGLSLLQTDGFDFYPFVQLGGAGTTLEVEQRDDPTWEETLGDPGRSSSLTSAFLYGTAGVGMDYTFRNGFFLGVRGSWAYTPPSDGWSDEEGEVLGGPEMDLSGPSVRLLLGFGGRN